MLTSILTPVVHGGQTKPSRRPWWKLALLYSSGNVVSATAVGVILTAGAWEFRQAVGSQAWRWGRVGAMLVVLAYLPRQLGWTRFPPLIQSTRQVPREWAYDYPRWITALLFGLGLGSGFYTRIGVPTFYLMLVWPFLTSSALLPVLVWSSYGLARPAMFGGWPRRHQ